MAGATFTITQSFGISGGPTFSGTTSVAPADDGNDYDVYNLALPAGGGSILVDDGGMSQTLSGICGFTLSVVNANGVMNPGAGLTFVGAGVAGADITISLSQGAPTFVQWNNAWMTGDASSITCICDATADLYLKGIKVTQYA